MAPVTVAGASESDFCAHTLVQTAKLNGVYPQAWLTDTLGRIADHKITRTKKILLFRRDKDIQPQAA